MCHGRSCHRVRSRPALVSFAIAQTVAVRRRRADIKAIRWIREPSHHALQPRRTRAHVRAPVRPIDGGGDPELMNALADTELLELERALASAPPRRAPAAATARATDPIVNPGAATARPTAMPGWTGLSAIPPPRINDGGWPAGLGVRQAARPRFRRKFTRVKSFGDSLAQLSANLLVREASIRKCIDNCVIDQ